MPNRKGQIPGTLPLNKCLQASSPAARLTDRASTFEAYGRRSEPSGTANFPLLLLRKSLPHQLREGLGQPLLAVFSLAHGLPKALVGNGSSSTPSRAFATRRSRRCSACLNALSLSAVVMPTIGVFLRDRLIGFKYHQSPEPSPPSGLMKSRSAKSLSLWVTTMQSLVAAIAANISREEVHPGASPDRDPPFGFAGRFRFGNGRRPAIAPREFSWPRFWGGAAPSG